MVTAIEKLQHNSMTIEDTGKTGLQVHLILAVLCRYLQKDKINGPEGNITFYELAERAIDGPVSEKIKEYVAQVCSLSICIYSMDEYVVFSINK